MADAVLLASLLPSGRRLTFLCQIKDTIDAVWMLFTSTIFHSVDYICGQGLGCF
uniref:Uncharacterized protein n=1 Tax=Talaromyces marneffei PM1 TaxID=1077442 RepID=A0A093UYR2_TALMA